MSDDAVGTILRRHDAMVTARRPWELHWSQVVRRVLPRADNFNRVHAPGDRRTEFISDSTAPMALSKFTAGMIGLSAPRQAVWHGLAASDRRWAANKIDVKRWFEEATQTLFQYRYAAHSGFETRYQETITSLGAFGTGPMWVEDDIGRGVIYQAFDLSEIYVASDKHGRIDTVSRAFSYTARQAAQRWGADKLPAAMRTALASNPDRSFEFIHYICPREDWDPERADFKGMRWASTYVAIEAKQILSEGGYHTMPLPVARYVTAAREDYGRSVAMDCLPDIKMVNEMAKTMIRAGHRAVDPPLNVAEDGVLSKLAMRPGAINYGGLSANGTHLVAPIPMGGDLAFGAQLLEQSRATIKEAFLVTVFQMLAEKGGDRMTATEVLERIQEKGVLLAPAVARIETELLGPMIEREVDILSRAGRLPPMPPALKDYLAQGGEYHIVYDNPMSRAARMEQATGFFRTIEALTPVANIDPGVLDVFDMEAAARGVAEIQGVPSAWQRSPDEVFALKEKRTQDAQVQQLAAAAPQAAKATLDIARAGAVGGEAMAA